MKLSDLATHVAAAEKSAVTSVPELTAYPFLPPARNGLNLPCIFNAYKLERSVVQGSFRYRVWTVFAQLLIGESTSQPDADSAKAADVLEEIFDGLLGTITLEGQVSMHDFRGEQERSIGVFEWNGINYVGADFAIEVTENSKVEVSA